MYFRINSFATIICRPNSIYLEIFVFYTIGLTIPLQKISIKVTNTYTNLSLEMHMTETKVPSRNKNSTILEMKNIKVLPSNR